MIVLRKYQQIQQHFAETCLETANTVAVESPTGSGKTYVILEVAKRWLEKNPLSNVVVSTGFNNLVFLMEQRALEMGLKPLVLIGSKALNCPKQWVEDGLEMEGFKPFTLERHLCGTKHNHLDVEHDDPLEQFCPFTIKEYRSLCSKISGEAGYVVITNHSTYLAHQELGTFNNCNLLVVDEAHTFSSFYDSWISLELDKNDLAKIEVAINKLKPPMNMLVKSNIMNGKPLPQSQVDALVNALKGHTRELARQFFETRPAPNNWIETDEGCYSISYFYHEFEMKRPKTLLMSATMDEFTLKMFGCSRNNTYREREQFCDYSQSEFIALPREDFKVAYLEFLDYVNEKGLVRGLCLSTTNHDVQMALECDGHRGYHMVTDLDEFLKADPEKKLVLCGSRALFQGIDIPNLNFVCLNRIPFPNWNDKARAMQDYLTNNGKNGFNPWKGFTIPKTQNDILQSSGRLWRDRDSKGVVSIFDDRIEKHGYMVKHCFNFYRHGIAMNIRREKNGPVEPFI
jgi:Rad3-related DNA helicase